MIWVFSPLPHSTRSSATKSRAATRVPIDTVLKSGVGGAWEHLLNITDRYKIRYKNFISDKKNITKLQL